MKRFTAWLAGKLAAGRLKKELKMHGWALPRWLSWVWVIAAALQTALGQHGLEIFSLTYHGQDLTGGINTAMAFLSSFSHSLSAGGLKLPPWFGALATFAATLATAGIGGTLGAVISLLAAMVASISRSIPNVTPNPAPASSAAMLMAPGVPAKPGP